MDRNAALLAGRYAMQAGTYDSHDLDENHALVDRATHTMYNYYLT
jgi:hypothetical protein